MSTISSKPLEQSFLNIGEAITLSSVFSETLRQCNKNRDLHAVQHSTNGYCLYGRPDIDKVLSLPKHWCRKC
jgi:hypothetical protein